MKEYLSPTIDIIKLQEEDVITNSSPSNPSSGDDTDDGYWHFFTI